MPRARSDWSIEAERRYLDGEKLCDIALVLDKTEQAVRQAKFAQKWDKKNNPNVRIETQANPNVRKRGGQPGNVTSTQFKKDNTASLVHGGYRAAKRDTFDDYENQLAAMVPRDEEELLVGLIEEYEIRERRLYIAIAKYRSMDSETAVSGVVTEVNKRDFDTPEEQKIYEERRWERVTKGDREAGFSKFTQTSSEPVIEKVLRLERELTSVQRAKVQCVQVLRKVREGREGSSSLADELPPVVINLAEGCDD